MTNHDYMSEANELSQLSRMVAPPNPWVGAIVVRNGEEYSRGRTGSLGEPHAEAAALAQLGSRAAGDEMFVTLEPCAHHGRTPPCAKAVAEAEVSTCHIATLDPDLKVDGAGVDYLVKNGVRVIYGAHQRSVVYGLAPYIKQRRTNLPWVTLKIAMSLDGRISAVDGSSKWITSAPARADAHLLRAHSQAIIVGGNTVKVDDPTLSARSIEGKDLARQPQRIVLGEIEDGAKVLPARSYKGDLVPLLKELGDGNEILQVLVEGGAKVNSALLDQDLVDEFVIYIAPMLFGGEDTKAAFVTSGAKNISDAWRSSFEDVVRVGDDLRVRMLSERAKALLDLHIQESSYKAAQLGAELVSDTRPVEGQHSSTISIK